jgi:hypothetical protein
MESCEKDCMSLWNLLVDILRSKVALCMVPLMFAVLTIGGRTIHPCCISDVCRGSYLYSFLVMVA